MYVGLYHCWVFLHCAFGHLICFLCVFSVCNCIACWNRGVAEQR